MKRYAVEDILAMDHPSPAAEAPRDSVVIGRLVALDAAGAPLVDYAENPAERPVPAAATRRYDDADVGRDVALMFIDGDAARPLLIGPLWQPAAPTTAPAAADAATVPATGVTVDGGITTITAENRIVLRCGAASITLTRAGKVLIRGKYLLSRSSGVNRIKGGSIQLN